VKRPRPRLVHLLPVAAPAGTPGWLLYAGRRDATVARGLPALPPELRTWDATARAWFVAEAGLDDALIVLENGLEGRGLVLCAACLEGAPCAQWDGVPRAAYAARATTPAPVAPEPPPAPPPPSPRSEPPPPSTPLDAWLYNHFVNAVPSPHAPPIPPVPPIPPIPSTPRVDPWPPWSFTPNTPLPGVEIPVIDISEGLGHLFNLFTEGLRARVPRRPPPPPVPAGQPGMSVGEAAAVLSLKLPCTLDEMVLAYRRAALRAHPDRGAGGSDAAMARVNAARDVLMRAVRPRG